MSTAADAPRRKHRDGARLGGGGMAEVFRSAVIGAEGFERPVAIKRILPSVSSDPRFAAMFVNEARISAMLQHPNIVPVLDFDRDDQGRLFLVMELVDGMDLATLVRRGPAPVGVVAYIVAEVLKALGHAHRLVDGDGAPLRIVHRDVSPHNVRLSRDGAVKLTDFGVAKALGGASAETSEILKGKPLYMAPEQVLDDERAALDLYDQAVATYEASGSDTENANMPGALSARANFFMEHHRYREAIPDLDRAIQLLTKWRGPAYYMLAQPLELLGHCYERLDRPADAIAPLEQALLLQVPKEYAQSQDLARFVLGRIVFETGRAPRRGVALVRSARANLAARDDHNVPFIDSWLAAYAPH